MARRAPPLSRSGPGLLAGTLSRGGDDPPQPWLEGMAHNRRALVRLLVRWSLATLAVFVLVCLLGRLMWGWGAGIEAGLRVESLSLARGADARPGSTAARPGKPAAFPPLPLLDLAREATHVPGPHSMTAERAFMINLEKRRDRRAAGTALARTLGLDLYISRASTVNSSEVLARRGLVHDDRMGGIWTIGSHVSLVEIACWASHARIWETALHLNLSSVLVMEDDVDFEYDSLQILRPLHALWQARGDILYLGHCDNPAGELLATAVADHSGRAYSVHVATHPSCTTAYIATRRGLAILRDSLQDPTEAIDDQIVDLVKRGKLRALSMHPPLAVQRQISAENPSDITNDSGFLYQVKIAGNYAWERFRGVRRDRLAHSAMGRAHRSGFHGGGLPAAANGTRGAAQETPNKDDAHIT